MKAPKILGLLRSWLRQRRPIAFSGETLALIETARERARSYAHDYVGVEHVFLSAWALPSDHAAHRMIAAIPVDVPKFVSELDARARVTTGRPVPEFIPQTPRLKGVLELAKYWARSSAGRDVEIVHVLGAIGHERNSLVSHVLREHLSSRSSFDKIVGAGAYFAIITRFPEVLTFDVHGRPNKSLQPTATAVMPPADAGDHASRSRG